MFVGVTPGESHVTWANTGPVIKANVVSDTANLTTANHELNPDLDVELHNLTELRGNYAKPHASGTAISRSYELPQSPALILLTGGHTCL